MCVWEKKGKSHPTLIINKCQINCLSLLATLLLIKTHISSINALRKYLWGFARLGCVAESLDVWCWHWSLKSLLESKESWDFPLGHSVWFLIELFFHPPSSPFSFPVFFSSSFLSYFALFIALDFINQLGWGLQNLSSRVNAFTLVQYHVVTDTQSLCFGNVGTCSISCFCQPYCLIQWNGQRRINFLSLAVVRCMIFCCSMVHLCNQCKQFPWWLVFGMCLLFM